MMDDLIFSNLISTVISKNQEKDEKKEKRETYERKDLKERGMEFILPLFILSGFVLRCCC